MSKTGNESELLKDKKVIELIVKPKSPKNNISFDSEKQVFTIRVKAPAEDGKANAEVLKLIKKETGKDARIISGATSRKKLVKLE